jgi:hypothetical protein
MIQISGKTVFFNIVVFIYFFSPAGRQSLDYQLLFKTGHPASSLSCRCLGCLFSTLRHSHLHALVAVSIRKA